MSSKGVSPMIAVVLLIAFTIAVGGIMSVWLTGYASTTQEAVENATTDQTKCAGTYIDVISVDTKAVLITNRGSQDITTVKCFTGNVTQLGDISGTLSPGGTDVSTWNATVGALADGTTNYESGFGTIVTCTGGCLSIGVTGECKSGQSCWKV